MRSWLGALACLAAAGSALAQEELPERLAGHGGPVMGIAADPGTGRALTASFDYSVIFWFLDGPEGEILQRLIGHEATVNDAAFVPGGERAVSASDDGSLAVWDLASGELLARLGDSPEKAVDVDVSPDGRLAAVARWDGTVRIIDLASLEEAARLEGHRGNVNAVAFSADGATLYTASYDGTILAWDATSGARKAQLHDNGWGINTLALVDDSLVFGSLDGRLARIDLATGDTSELADIERPFLSLAVSADGERLAAGAGDGHIRVFRTRDWSLEEDYENVYGPVWGLAFADTAGDLLYHSGLDDFAILWQVSPRRPFEPVEGEFPRRFQVSEAEDEGEREFLRKCSVCHTLGKDGKNRAGPTLFGVFGRRAGSLPDYPYSQALRESDIVWDEETISQLFDHGPDVVTPGSKMPIQVLSSVERREALIAYLKGATDPDRVDRDERGQEAGQ
ncbi:MAG TPA: PQQ-binding-like beta-propeller repeat protein [Afifellaceae bacterium]|nr:PQQ-binding-like beta-propeller repeat protein [Afifellaceae bacterium]